MTTPNLRINQRIAIEKIDFREADEIVITKDLDMIVAEASFKFLNRGGSESELEKYDRVVIFADYGEATTPLIAGYINKISKGYSKTSDYIKVSCLDNLGILNELEAISTSMIGNADVGGILYNVLESNRIGNIADLSQINQATSIYNDFSFRKKKLIQLIEQIKKETIQLIFLDNRNFVQNKVPAILFTEEETKTYRLERGRNIIAMSFGDVTSNINRVVVHGRTENAIGIAQDLANMEFSGRVNELVLERRGVDSWASARDIARNKLIECGKNYIVKATMSFTPEMELGQLVQVFDPKNGLDGQLFMIRNYTHTISKTSLKTEVGLTANVLSMIPETVLTYALKGEA